MLGKALTDELIFVATFLEFLTNCFQLTALLGIRRESSKVSYSSYASNETKSVASSLQRHGAEL